MLAGLFQWLFGNVADPTRDWPTGTGELPVFDLRTFSWGSLKFGDPLEAAQFLGPPDEFVTNRQHPNWCSLQYNRAGFLLDFQDGRFHNMFIFIGEGGEFERKSTHPKCSPKLSNREVLTDLSTPDQILRSFGESGKLDDQDDELFDENSVMITYDDLPIGMEFEFNQQARLVYWHLWKKPEKV